MLRNLLYGYAVMPVSGWSGAGLFVLVSLWAMLRNERRA